jgi:hypothetical protein
LLFLELFFNFLSLNVGFFLLNSKLLDFELFSFYFASDLVHEFFLLESILNLSNFDIGSTACGTVISRAWKESFSDKFFSLSSKQIYFLFSSFFIMRNFDL